MIVLHTRQIICDGTNQEYLRGSDAIKDATNNAILREFVMSKVSCESLIDAPTGAKRIRYGDIPRDDARHQPPEYL